MDISLFDLLFLLTESEESPKHVAGLQVFTVPEQYSGDFVFDLYNALLKHDNPQAPFDQVLKKRIIGLPYFEKEQHLDFKYHIRHVSLPRPGNHQQFMDYVERVHANLLDRSRPLWEMYLIEGLEKNQFAIYYKFHHVYADGMALIDWMKRSLSLSPDDRVLRAVWDINWFPDKAKKASDNYLLELLDSALGTVKTGFNRTKNLYLLLLKMSAQIVELKPKTLSFPFDAPKSIFNTHISKARRIAITSVPLQRINETAHAANVTLNEVLLTISDMALQNFLVDHNQLPDKPLVIQMPISTRTHSTDSGGEGNSISLLPVRLTTSKNETPYQRLIEIQTICKEIKNEVKTLTADAFAKYALLNNGFSELCEQLGLTEYVPPFANGVISNVSGPKRKRYFMGAEMTAFYPISTLPPGTSMNITAISYADNLSFGIIGSRAAVPDLNLLAGYIHTAFEELESSVQTVVKNG
jgi:diacylglycerol O-acyltransferase